MVQQGRGSSGLDTATSLSCGTHCLSESVDGWCWMPQLRCLLYHCPLQESSAISTRTGVCASMKWPVFTMGYLESYCPVKHIQGIYQRIYKPKWSTVPGAKFYGHFYFSRSDRTCSTAVMGQIQNLLRPTKTWFLMLYFIKIKHFFCLGTKHN